MRFELILSPQLYEGRQLRDDLTVVAVDVLRASSTICAAFCSGVRLIVPLDSLEPLQDFRRQGFVLAAERNGSKVEGATCGNSPTEYLALNLDGQRLAYSTTNGTVAILRARDADSLYVGCFANLNTLADRLLQKCNNLVVLCSGWKGDPSIEDTLFGGALQAALRAKGADIEAVNDAAMMAEDLWHAAKGDLYAYCQKATHVHRLQRLDYDRDIRWCLTPDTCPVVPCYDKGQQALVALESQP